MTNKKNNEFTLLEVMGAGGVAACFAEFCTIPMDTIKVRMQNLQDVYKQMLPAYKQIYREEGIFAFYRGLSAGFLRQITFASLRLGLYDYGIQNLENKGVNVGLLHQLATGIVSGGVSIAIANPFDVLKVKFQSDIMVVEENGRKVIKRNYNNLRHAVFKIKDTEGIKKGYYLSLWPNIMRNSIVNAIELTAFSQFITLFRYILNLEISWDGLMMDCCFIL
jgi:solute carrier family 25 uncoupling protein 8/9